MPPRVPLREGILGAVNTSGYIPILPVGPPGHFQNQDGNRLHQRTRVGRLKQIELQIGVRARSQGEDPTLCHMHRSSSCERSERPSSDEEGRGLGPGADLQNTHASHIQPATFLRMHHADERGIAGGTADDRPHAMRVGSQAPQSHRWRHSPHRSPGQATCQTGRWLARFLQLPGQSPQ